VDPSHFVVKLTVRKDEDLNYVSLKLNDTSFSCFVTMHSGYRRRRRRQTTHNQTLHCNSQLNKSSLTIIEYIACFLQRHLSLKLLIHAVSCAQFLQIHCALRKTVDVCYMGPQSHRLLSVGHDVCLGQEERIHHLSLYKLLPATSDYITYDGSMTQPGCQETVTWIIFNRPLYMSIHHVSCVLRLISAI